MGPLRGMHDLRFYPLLDLAHRDSDLKNSRRFRVKGILDPPDHQNLNSTPDPSTLNPVPLHSLHPPAST